MGPRAYQYLHVHKSTSVIYLRLIAWSLMCILIYIYFQVNCEEQFHTWFTEIVTFGESQDITVITARVVQHQAHRANTPSESPVLDHILSEMDSRFGELHQLF